MTRTCDPSVRLISACEHTLCSTVTMSSSVVGSHPKVLGVSPGQMRHSDPSASITVWLRSCRLICIAASPLRTSRSRLLAGRPHPLDDLLANGRIVLCHHHDRGIFFNRKALVGDGLHELLVGLVHKPLFVSLAGGRLNLLRIALLYVGNLVEGRRRCIQLLIRDVL